MVLGDVVDVEDVISDEVAVDMLCSSVSGLDFESFMAEVTSDVA